MWKLLSLKQKMYHLCETHSCHMIPDLFYKRWLQVHLWMLLTTLSWEIMDFICEYKSSETPTFILGVLSFPLLACILATLKTALHMKLYIKRPLYIDHLVYIWKDHLRRKIEFSKSTWIPLGEIWDYFDSKCKDLKVRLLGANCISSLSSIFLSYPCLYGYIFMYSLCETKNSQKNT